MSETPQIDADEISLGEVFLSLWSHKFLIGLITFASVLYASYYTLTTKKEYTAKAIFELQQQENRGFELPGEFGALASFAGFATSGGSDGDILLERVEGREFILVVSKELSLEKDPLFNTYNPNTKDPFWKSTIKKLIDWKSIQASREEIIENDIVRNYLKLVFIEQTSAGAIALTVKHQNGETAAHYANKIMKQIRKLVENESAKNTERRLSYLSETLADALQDLEETQKKLKDFALKNSAAAQENFLSGTLQLDDLRIERRKTREILDLLDILENTVKKNELNNQSYLTLRTRYPLVDDVDFRRILGMSETISSWSWPDLITIETVGITLKDRLNRLEVEISNFENNAKMYASSAEDLEKLKRDAKIAEATYTVLIEQVKSQSIAAGFRSDVFNVFEYAVAPLAPSSPNRNFNLIIGALLGLFISCAVALINSVRRGIYFTESSIAYASKASLVLRSSSFRKISSSTVSKIIFYISKRRISEIDEAEIKLSNRNLVYVMNCGGKPSASGTARILATQSSSSGRTVVLCDKSAGFEKEIEGTTITNVKGLTVEKVNNGLNLLKGDNGPAFFTSANFKPTIKTLMSTYDQVFVCSGNKENILGLMALKDFDPSIVLLARLRKTSKKDIKRVTAIRPIDILFYD